MTYNSIDAIHYGTLAERDSAQGEELLTKEGTKFYVYGDATNQGVLYISNGTIWTLA